MYVFKKAPIKHETYTMVPVISLTTYHHYWIDHIVDHPAIISVDFKVH